MSSVPLIEKNRKNHRVGSTSLCLPAVGFGAAPLGNLYVARSDADAAATIQAALSAHIRYFDTAPYYGFGLSEQRLGAALRPPAAEAGVVISTKVGRALVPAPAGRTGSSRHGFIDGLPFEPVFDYSYDGVMRSFDESVRRLDGGRIDILLAHDLGQMTHGAAHLARWSEFLAGGYRAMCRLRDDNAVRAIGLGVNEIDVCLQALHETDVDCFLLAGRYTLLDQSAVDVLLPECVGRGVSVIIGAPFNSGILIEGVDGTSPAHFDYSAASPDVIARVRRLTAVCSAHRVPIASAAIQFPLAHPAVVSVIPGLATPEEVHQVGESLRVLIPPSLWSDLRAEGLLHPCAPTPHPASAEQSSGTTI
jgi:D-threo-aldose 1-dehydrogenase